MASSVVQTVKYEGAGCCL